MSKDTMTDKEKIDLAKLEVSSLLQELDVLDMYAKGRSIQIIRDMRERLNNVMVQLNK